VEKFSITALAALVPTEADAYKLIEELRWGDRPVCPHCGHDGKCYFLNPANGVSRKTRTGAASQRRVWKCGACKRQFSALTGTIFHGTKIPLRKWVLVVFEMGASKNGIAAREIERKYDMAPRSAWFMLHRIREAMKREPLVGMLSGTVVADETYIGGKLKNKHRQGVQRKAGFGAHKGPLGGQSHLTPVLSLVSRETGEVRSRVMPEVTAATLAKAIAEQVDVASSHLHTDAAYLYRALGREFQSHEWVDHHKFEYVRGDVSTNQAENFFSQLKRSIDGTHHHVSTAHLLRYLAEFDFRFSTCQDSDTARMRRLMQQVAGRRLSYRPLVGSPEAA
jgi:transposase-like protein